MYSSLGSNNDITSEIETIAQWIDQMSTVRNAETMGSTEQEKEESQARQALISSAMTVKTQASLKFSGFSLVLWEEKS